MSTRFPISCSCGLKRLDVSNLSGGGADAGCAGRRQRHLPRLRLPHEAGQALGKRKPWEPFTLRGPLKSSRGGNVALVVLGMGQFHVKVCQLFVLKWFCSFHFHCGALRFLSVQLLYYTEPYGQ